MAQNQPVGRIERRYELGFELQPKSGTGSSPVSGTGSGSGVGPMTSSSRDEEAAATGDAVDPQHGRIGSVQRGADWRAMSTTRMQNRPEWVKTWRPFPPR